MRFKYAFFFLALAATAQADWTILSTESEPGREGLVHTHVVLENPVGGERITVDLVIFSTKSCTLRVLQNESRADRYDRSPGTPAGTSCPWQDAALNFSPRGPKLPRQEDGRARLCDLRRVFRIRAGARGFRRRAL